MPIALKNPTTPADLIRRADLRAEAEAWERIAVRLQDPHIEDYMVTGLCHEIFLEFMAARISKALYERMCGRIVEHMVPIKALFDYDYSGYYAPRGERGPRIMAAAWFALECEQEATA